MHVELLAGHERLLGSDAGELSAAEASDLFSEAATQDLLLTAKCLRNSRKPGSVVTYSRKVFLNLVNLCRDTCSYCTYKKEPGEEMVSMLSPGQVLAIAGAGHAQHCTEALFVTGERPEQKYPEARDWLQALGYSSTVEYLSEMSAAVLEKTGLLPHTNAGSLTKKEMQLLKESNVSLGVMLESASERLTGDGMPHANAPSKHPKVRAKTLQDAGELRIPMTTGLLVGIGETQSELVESLYVIKEINKRYGHIQEVIMQNFAPKPSTGMADALPPMHDYFLRAVAMARIIMPDMNIQVPPNLTPEIFGSYLDAGINDWGGISPVTIDHVNPEFPWPGISLVKKVTEDRGMALRARLPVYPEFLKGGFITSEPLQNAINLLTDGSGLVRRGYADE